jgi:hypothetical protein
MDERKRARNDRDGLSRRDFARRAALAAAGVAMLPRDLLALAGETKPDSSAAVSKGSGGTPPEPKLSDASRAEAEARIDAILRKRGERLNEAQRAEIRRLVLQGQKSLDTLRAFPLANADEPATVLHLQIHEEA